MDIVLKTMNVILITIFHKALILLVIPMLLENTLEPCKRC